MLKGSYKANPDGTIGFRGNELFEPIDDVKKVNFPSEEIAENRVRDISTNERWLHMAMIENELFRSCAKYFSGIGAMWVNLPLTTLMISSPGEIFAGKGKAMDYTTDTLPVELNWFDAGRVFLSESSQIYLELMLCNPKINSVWSYYNSFRKEPADTSHLSEFSHVEYEGKHGLDKNVETFLALADTCRKDLIEKVPDSLAFFIGDHGVRDLSEESFCESSVEIPLREALDMLYRDTGNEKYRPFTMENLNSWEEVRLTELAGNKPVLLTKMPLMEIPFYHQEFEESVDGILVANNTDMIMPNYREVVGAGARVKCREALKEKERVFKLPKGYYDSYLESRDLETYEQTAGFGMGIQRFLQYVTNMPHIWDVCAFPRGHTVPKP